MKLSRFILLGTLILLIAFSGCTEKEENIVEPSEYIHVISTTPEANAIKVDYNTSISVLFSSVIDTNSIDSNSFIVGDSINGIFQVIDSTVIFTPSVPLDSGKVYTVTILSSIKDIKGNALESDFTFTFRTFMPLQNGEILQYSQGEVFFHELTFEIGNKYQLLHYWIYLPFVSLPSLVGGSEEKVPILFLLTPDGGGKEYYFDYGLKELADTLISEGLINPLAVVCIQNNNIFGGSFYANSTPPGGNYDLLFDSALLHVLKLHEYFIDTTISPSIAGIGKSAYGAFRAALLNPENYTSVSGIEGPLDFDGSDGISGFISFFDDALTEQGLNESTYKQFDSSSLFPISQLFVSGSYCFSPHDTAVNYDISFNSQGEIVKTITERFSIEDSTTLISGIVGADYYNFAMHLPFDGSGLPYPFIWENYWLSQNPENLLSPSFTKFADSMIFLGVNSKTLLGFDAQTISWQSTLAQNSYNIEFNDYSFITDDLEQMQKQLKDILIFTSKSFSKEKK